MSRKESTRIFIERKLRMLLEAARDGNYLVFDLYSGRLSGCLDYACCMGDISWKNKKRVECIVRAINRKYF